MNIQTYLCPLAKTDIISDDDVSLHAIVRKYHLCLLGAKGSFETILEMQGFVPPIFAWMFFLDNYWNLGKKYQQHRGLRFISLVTFQADNLIYGSPP